MIVDWSHDVWTNTHSTRPQKHGCNLLASWHLAAPKARGKPEIIPQPAGGGDRNAVPLYDFPRQRVTHHFIPRMPIRVSALRSLGAYANIFAIETFMDELAMAARVDPVEFRLRHLNDARARAVIEPRRRAGRLAAGPARRHRPRARLRLRQIQEPLGLSRPRRRCRCRPQDRRRARHQGACDDRCRPGHQPRRARQPNRRRHHPGSELDAQGGGRLQSAAHHLARLVALSRSSPSPRCPRSRSRSSTGRRRTRWAPAKRRKGPTAAAIANAVAHATGARLRDLPLLPERVEGRAFG